MSGAWLSKSVRWRWVVILALGSSVLACSSEPSSAPPRGQLGIFYGGQVQELEVVEWILERPAKLGFRLTLPEGQGESFRVRWQIVRPGPSGRRVTEMGSIDVPRGRGSFDREIDVKPAPEWGTWNVRVTVDELLVIDRALRLKKSSSAG